MLPGHEGAWHILYNVHVCTCRYNVCSTYLYMWHTCRYNVHVCTCSTYLYMWHTRWTSTCDIQDGQVHVYMSHTLSAMSGLTSRYLSTHFIEYFGILYGQSDVWQEQRHCCVLVCLQLLLLDTKRVVDVMYRLHPPVSWLDQWGAW